MFPWFPDPVVYALLKNRRPPSLDELEAALAQGADLNAPDHRGYVPLSARSVRADLSLVHWLVANGANPNALNRGKPLLASGFQPAALTHTPQERAAHVAYLKELLAVGADPNLSATTVEGSPLWLAIQWGVTEMIEPLVAHGADATTPNEAGETALDWALQCEDAEAAQAVGGGEVERRIATEIPDPQVKLIQQELASKLELHRQVLQVKRGNTRQDGDAIYEWFWRGEGFATLRWDPQHTPNLSQADYHHLGPDSDRLVKSIAQALALNRHMMKPRRRAWRRVNEGLTARSSEHLVVRRFGEP